ATSARPSDDRRRRVRLLVRRNAGGSRDAPFYEYAIQDGVTSPSPDSGLRYGRPLVLTRGEPVSITVVNQLDEPTAVHWHGIELESYFDGVPGFSGAGKRLAPAIAPGDSFVARFTPPRAGTFIYHTHFDEERQQLAGLVGPIVVIEPGVRYDPATDRAIIITSPTSFADQQRLVSVDGQLNPAPLVLRAGVAYRLRFLNMTVRRPTLQVDLMRDSTLLQWRLIAADGASLPGAHSPTQAHRLIALGETFDVEVTPGVPGDQRLEIRIGGRFPPHTLLGTLPVRVVP
ncbi:MAG: multicopper oxidase domain-containing protein, partial [bacterium]